MFNKHKEFVNSLRSIMRNTEIERHPDIEKADLKKNTESSDGGMSSTDAELVAKIIRVFQ